MSTFGPTLKHLRISYGITQTEFAQILSKLTGSLITRSAVSMWECGQRIPKSEILKTIADYFDVSTDTLLGRREPSKELWKGDSGEQHPDIRIIGRASQRMTPEQRQDMIKVMRIMFPEAFEGEP